MPETIVIAVLVVTVFVLAFGCKYWQEVAHNRQLFIDECRQASEPLSGWLFGPSFLRHLQTVIDSKGRAVICLRYELVRSVGKSRALEGQAKRWARIARDRQATIDELTALAENDTERIQCPQTISVVRGLRKTARLLTWLGKTKAARTVQEAATLISVMVLRTGSCLNDSNGDGDCAACADKPRPRLKQEIDC